MSTKYWLLIALAVIVILLISVGVAYSRGRASGQLGVQHDQEALKQVQQKLAATEAELARVTAEANARRAQVDEILQTRDEATRLKRLADLANDWKVPR